MTDNTHRGTGGFKGDGSRSTASLGPLPAKTPAKTPAGETKTQEG